ncbi:GNAT family N-acetyltransferase [Fodinicola feengrottensis]|uniref:GNAT family N-acetyltransferase n=1 Tax=Fodinicola feengrottensis TaxID=435914 RepID=A0ABN2FVP5_9ACTN
MEIKVVDNPAKSRFEAYDGDSLAGFAQYVLAGDRITFTHTQVESAFGGKGVGGQLARTALDAARERGLGVLPDCPFIRGWIAKHPDYVDLVPAGERDAYQL